MTIHRVGIIMNGVTGRMGTNQHLVRSILAIREQGGVALPGGDVIMPDPLLVGRNAGKLRQLAEAHGGLAWSTDLDSALRDESYSVYFDSQTTERRPAGVHRAIDAGKHVYCEKPTATTTAEAMALHRHATQAGVKHGVVQDKLWLPGLVKLRRLIDSGFFGRILSVRGEFGYWVFSGEHEPLQRPSWNYRKELGGGIIVDMLCHWRYVVDNLFGSIREISCLGATHLKRRWDEQAAAYTATADDAAYATFITEREIVCQFNSSWCTRVDRRELFEMHVDGTQGSAIVGLRYAKVQPAASTPRATWNPDIDDPNAYQQAWLDVPTVTPLENAFKIQWEHFLRHIVRDEPFPWDLREAAKGIQLAELGLESWAQRRWLAVGELETHEAPFAEVHATRQSTPESARP